MQLYLPSSDAAVRNLSDVNNCFSAFKMVPQRKDNLDSENERQIIYFTQVQTWKIYRDAFKQNVSESGQIQFQIFLIGWMHQLQRHLLQQNPL